MWAGDHDRTLHLLDEATQKVGEQPLLEAARVFTLLSIGKPDEARQHARLRTAVRDGRDTESQGADCGSRCAVAAADHRQVSNKGLVTVGWNGTICSANGSEVAP
jgi:hypothetical protein